MALSGVGIPASAMVAGVSGMGVAAQRTSIAAQQIAEEGVGILLDDFSMGPLLGMSEHVMAVLNRMPPDRLMDGIRDMALGLTTYGANGAVVRSSSEFQRNLLAIG